MLEKIIEIDKDKQIVRREGVIVVLAGILISSILLNIRDRTRQVIDPSGMRTNVQAKNCQLVSPRSDGQNAGAQRE